MKHKSERQHDCVFSLFIHKVENVNPAQPFYIKWHYKHETGKTKGRVSDANGGVDFGEEFSFDATLFESEDKASHRDSEGPNPSRESGNALGVGPRDTTYDPKHLYVSFKEGSGEHVSALDGSLKSSNTGGAVVCQTCINLSDHIHPFATTKMVVQPLTANPFGPKVYVSVKCFLRHNPRYGPKHIGDGMVIGASRFGVGLGYGLLGVVYDPYIGWKNQAWLGLFKGILIGILGFAIRPLIGLFQLVVYSLWGLGKTPYTAYKWGTGERIKRDIAVIKEFQEEFPKFSLKAHSTH